MTLKVRVLRVLLDILSLIFVILPAPLLQYLGKPHQRGLTCVENKPDPDVSQPYRDSTVTNALLMACVFGIPCISILFGEVLSHFKPKTRATDSFKATCGYTSCRIHPIIAKLYTSLGFYLFGIAITVSLTNIGKFTVGRLRPHFATVCQPILPSGCSGAFIEDFQCADNRVYTQAQLTDARLSFPSGHASMTAFCAVFLAIYFQYRMPLISGFFRRFLQIGLIALAFYTGLSRVMDNKHHPTDVLAGFIIGSAVAIWIGLAAARREFKAPDNKRRDSEASGVYAVSERPGNDKAESVNSDA